VGEDAPEGVGGLGVVALFEVAAEGGDEVGRVALF
jgi:hypothetical protein